jgi:hypothetical protein
VANQLQQKELEFHDVIEYNPRCIASPPYTLAVRTESPFLKDKLDVQLTLTIEELEGGASCRQVRRAARIGSLLWLKLWW